MSKNIRPAKVISVIQRKGGAGKTTLMHHLCAGLALAGYDALAIETDDNTRLRAILAGLSVEDEQELDDGMTAYNLFTHPEEGTGRMALRVDLDRLWENVSSVHLNDIHTIRVSHNWQTPGKFHYIPGSERLKDIDDEFATRTIKESGFLPDQQLTLALKTARNDYDVIAIDSPPSLTNTLANIIAASTHIVIPVDFDFASIEDYKRTIRMVKRVGAGLRARNIALPTVLVVFNKFNIRNENHRRIMAAYTTRHEESVNGQKIQRDALIPQRAIGTLPFDIEGLIDSAAMNNRSLHQYAPLSDVGVAMYDMVQQFESVIGLQ